MRRVSHRLVITCKEKWFEEIDGVIRSRTLTDKQYNGQAKKNKWTKHLQDNTQTTNYRATPTALKPG